MLSSVIITGEQAILTDSTIDVSGISESFSGTVSKTTFSRNLKFTFYPYVSLWIIHVFTYFNS